MRSRLPYVSRGGPLHRLPLLALVLGACTTHQDIVPTCESVSDVAVSPDDTSLGFSAEDAVAALDGRAWGVAWQDEELYAGSSIAELTTTATLAGDVRKVELADVGGCDYVGTFLRVPIELAFADADGTFAASGATELAAFGRPDDAIALDFAREEIAVSALPEDLAAAGEDALTTGTPGELSLTLEGRASTPLLHLQALAEAGNQLAAVATAALTPE